MRLLKHSYVHKTNPPALDVLFVACLDAATYMCCPSIPRCRKGLHRLTCWLFTLPPYRLFFDERWGLCAEAMGRWDGALGLFERGSNLLQPGTALLKVALAGAARARTNRDADRKVGWPGDTRRVPRRHLLPGVGRLRTGYRQ